MAIKISSNCWATRNASVLHGDGVERARAKLYLFLPRELLSSTDSATSCARSHWRRCKNLDMD